MLTYSFANIGSDSLYIHLYKCIKNDIINGVLSTGVKLPSKRSFAKNLGISTITVETAYEQLRAEGYIYSIPKKGFFIADVTGIALIKSKPQTQTAHCVENYSRYVSDFISNLTNPDNFPFSVWARLMREVMAEKQDELVRPSPCGGLRELRLAICSHLRQFRSMSVEPDQVIIGAGTEYLYGLLIQLLGREKIYAVENPGYKKIYQIYKSNGVNCSYISLDDFGIDVQELELSNAEIVHISPSHHYPTGKVTPVSRRYELLGWASKSKNRYIIEDDYDSEFRLTGKPIPTMQSIDVSEKVIYMNTFTKSLASTIRVSYMVLPPHLLEKFYKDLSFYSCTVSNFEQFTLARFISGGWFEKHINRMRNYYRGVRDTLLEQIKTSPLSEKVSISEEEAGLHFLMKVDTDCNDEELIRRAETNGIRISCLSQYYYSTCNIAQEHTVIINYSGLHSENACQAIRLLNEII
ncbi:MAG: GntR family transcriptional regulator [Clostridiales bacterium]|nr:MAG: GntR family transcriptional regulator [Clostridiales bacterium]